MIIMMFKFMISFVISFIILTIPVNNRSLFYHISAVTGPVGIGVSEKIGKNISAGLKTTKDIGKQLFINSEPPKDPVIRDLIQRKQAAIAKKRKEILKGEEKLLQEEISFDDTKELDRLIEVESN